MDAVKVGAWLHERGSSEAVRAVRVVVELGQIQRLLSLSEARALHGALGGALEEARAAVDLEDDTADVLGDDDNDDEEAS